MKNPQPNFPMVDIVTGQVTTMQDGLKLPFLCLECEQKIGRWERNFKERFFDRFNERPAEPREYLDWLPRFCVSIVWRVLQLYEEQGGSQHWPPHVAKNVADALQTWRAFLNHEKRSPRPHDVHLVPFPADVGEPHYARHTLEMSFAVNRRTDEQYVFVKLGALLLVGVVNDSESKRWKRTRIEAVKGVWGQREFGTPATVLDYIERRARHVAEVTASWPVGPAKDWPRSIRPKKR
jgi:hypothetical protein